MQACWTNLSSREIIVACRFNVYTLILWGFFFLFFFPIKKKSMEEILLQNIDKDREIASLKAEVATLSQKSPVQPKAKRGLLANIREAVTSPRKCTPSRTLRKTLKSTPRWKSQRLGGREFGFLKAYLGQFFTWVKSDKLFILLGVSCYVFGLGFVF